MTTIECPVCGMTYTGKKCPICGAKVKIRYRERGQAAQAAPMPEPTVYEEPQSAAMPGPAARRQPVRSKPKQAVFGMMVAAIVIFASSIFGLLGVSNRFSRSHENDWYMQEYSIDEDMTDYGIEPQTVYDANGVKVVIEAFATNDYMTEIYLHLVNDNDFSVQVSSELATIDGVASDEWIYTPVEANSEAYDVITIFDSNLEDIGLEAVHEFAFNLVMRNEETYQELDRSERIVFQTPIEGTASHVAPDGTVVYDENGIRVTRVEEIVEDYRFAIRYYVENNSDRNLTIFGSDDLLVNGEEVSSSYVYGSDIPAGSVGYFQAVVYDYDDTVKDISGTVMLKEFYTWEDIGQFSIE